MSVGMVRGLLTAVLFVAFIALWWWAWSKQRQPDFETAARLPFDDGEALTPERSEQQS
jgi:cytochrome c oxidase cbb3-type subunit 4